MAATRGVVAGLGAYTSLVRERGAPFAEALAGVASVVLRAAVTSTERAERDAGLAAVRSLGTAGRDVVGLLRDRPGVAGVRATALFYDLDVRDGPPPARLVIALASPDDETRCAALGALEGMHDAVSLAQVLGRDVTECRRQAVLRLVRLRADPAARLAVVGCAMRTDDERVRAMCTAALGGLGREVSDVLVIALDDRASLVRDAAAEALVRVDPAMARQRFGALLTAPPTSLSIEIARALSSDGDPIAIAHILGALAGGDAATRAHAAVASSSFAPRDRLRLVSFANHADPEVAVRVCAALARTEVARGVVLAALDRLAAHPDPWVAVRALDVLAEMRESSAEPLLRAALRAPRADVRRVAAVAWSRLASVTGDADALAPLLLDPDRDVRLTAAAEIVRTAAR